MASMVGTGLVLSPWFHIWFARFSPAFAGLALRFFRYVTKVEPRRWKIGFI